MLFDLHSLFQPGFSSREASFKGKNAAIRSLPMYRERCPIRVLHIRRARGPGFYRQHSVFLVGHSEGDKHVTKCFNTRTSCAGLFVSRGILGLLRRTNQQCHDLQTAVGHDVREK